MRTGGNFDPFERSCVVDFPSHLFFGAIQNDKEPGQEHAGDSEKKKAAGGGDGAERMFHLELLRSTIAQGKLREWMAEICRVAKDSANRGVQRAADLPRSAAQTRPRRCSTGKGVSLARAYQETEDRCAEYGLRLASSALRNGCTRGWGMVIARRNVQSGVTGFGEVRERN